MGKKLISIILILQVCHTSAVLAAKGSGVTKTDLLKLSGLRDLTW